MIFRNAFVPMLAVTVVAALASRVVAVEIKMRDGRTLTGVATQSGDTATVQLLIGTKRAHMVLPLRISDMASVTDGGKRWLPADFEKLQAMLPPPAKSLSQRKALLQETPVEEKKPKAEDQRQATQRPRVWTIDADARAMNWNGNPEWDGIAVRVRPLDRFGNVLPLSGTVDVTLEVAGNPTALAPFWSRVHSIGNWRKSVRSSDYGPDGATVFLPFQGVRPERSNTRRHRDLTIGPHGDIHLRMTIAGHGVFPAFVDTVRIRRFSELRDRLYHERGKRFYQGE